MLHRMHIHLDAHFRRLYKHAEDYRKAVSLSRPVIYPGVLVPNRLAVFYSACALRQQVVAMADASKVIAEDFARALDR